MYPLHVTHVKSQKVSHAFWSCHKIWPCWQHIFEFLSEAYKIDLAPEPKVGIFGDTSSIGNKYLSQAISL